MSIQQALLMVNSVTATVINLTASTNTSTYDLYTAAGSPVGPAYVTLTINSGVFLFGTSTGNYGLDTGTAWATGTTLTVINNGNITGSSGSGGLNDRGLHPGYDGNDGGPAIHAQYAVSITNNGNIASGGGGGGQGGIGNGTGGFASGGFGGDGRGGTSSSGTVGQKGGAGGADASNPGGNGGTGGATISNGNDGSNGGVSATGGGGGGGAGGGWGCYGGDGGDGNGTVTANTPGGQGGAPGSYIVGDSNITWTAIGSRYGRVDNTGISAFGGALSANFTTNGTAASVTLTFNTNGQITQSSVADSGQVNTVALTRAGWYKPSTVSIGTSYWIRATLSSGSSPSSGDVVGSWLQLSSARAWTYTSGTTTSSNTGTLLIEISSSATGTPILTGGSVVFTATHT